MKGVTIMHLSWAAVAMSALPAASFVPTGNRRSTRQTMHMSIPNAIDTLTSGLASICRLPYGITVSGDASSDLPGGQTTRPRLVELYDIENDGECRAVRELITELDLVVERVIPSAPNSRVFEQKNYEFALPASMKTSLPRLVAVDPAGEEIICVGKAEIVSYLDTNFASSTSESPDESGEMKAKAMAAINDIGTFLAGLLRFGRGTTVSAAAEDKMAESVPRPSQPLILYSYEGNQFCRLVREVLTELDIVYELRSAGKESPRREELATITGGSTQCPFLMDPNTGTQMAESADIIRYLYKNYALWTPPNEILQAASEKILPLFRPLFSTLTPIQVGSYRDDKAKYEVDIANAKAQIEREVAGDSVVIYTYSLSPFSSEAKALLDNIGVTFREISLGKEWLPGLISEPLKRAALFEMTGQSSLPHVFVGGKSIGGLFSGAPGLVPALEEGTFLDLVETAKGSSVGAFD